MQIPHQLTFKQRNGLGTIRLLNFGDDKILYLFHIYKSIFQICAKSFKAEFTLSQNNPHIKQLIIVGG